MRLQKTAVASASTTSPKTSPSSISTIAYSSSPNSDGNWTSKTFFTCPSTALYAKIYFTSSNASGGTVNYFASNGTGYYEVKFGGSVIFAGHTNTTYGFFYINQFQASTSSTSFFAAKLEDNDAMFSNNFTGIIIPGSRLILNPGEKFEVTSSTGSNTASITLNAEAHVFNAA